MKRPWLLLALTALVAMGLLLLLSRSEVGGPSALSRGPWGLLAARRYLEARGIEVALLDRSVTALDPEAVAVTAFPWQSGTWSTDYPALRAWVEGGGTLVVAFSGEALGRSQGQLFRAFALSTTVAKSKEPLGYASWREWVREEWQLTANPAFGAGPALRLRAPRQLPVPPPAAEVLYVEEGGEVPVAFGLELGKGRAYFLPAELLANARIGEPGHADLLESLARRHPGPWHFDEYHHGLVAAGEAASRRPTLAFDLFLLHLALLYGLGLVTLGRRFGAPWREPPARAGSAGAFLLGLGRLHDRLRHYPAAGPLLLARAQELDPRLRLPEELKGRAAPERAVELVALARDLADSKEKR